MEPLTLVGREQAPLVEEEWKQLDEAVVKAARRVLVGRKVLPVYNLADVGVMEVQWDELTELSPATISMYGETPIEDVIKYTRKSLVVPIIHKDFRIHWRDLIASRRKRVPLDTANAESAALVVARLEDELILTGEYTGSPKLGIEGLATATGRNTTASLGAWATSPNAVNTVKNAMEELTVDNFYGPYDLILQPSAFLDAHTFIGNTAVMQIDKIRELIGGNIYVTPALKAADGGTDNAILMETGAENADLCVAQDLKTFYLQLQDMNHFFKCYEAVVPRIKRPTAICEISGIT
ncbi:MAG: family 1 encapsulin nanocompartment shell protein [Candidatus Bathyarchaeia archaeon]